MSLPSDGDPAEVSLEDAMHGWAWRAGTAPKRVEVESCLGTFGSEASPPTERTSNLRIEVALPGHLNSELRAQVLAGRVVSAPAAMWEDVPEDRMPSFQIQAPDAVNGPPTVTVPIDPERPWRLRLIAGDVGSGWLDLPPAVTTGLLVARTAAERRWQVVDTDDQPANGARLSLLRAGSRPSDLTKIADFRATEAGMLRVPSLPAGEVPWMLIAAEGFAPLLVRDDAQRTLDRLVLSRGAEIQGRFVADDGLPVHGVRVRARGWLAEELPVPFTLWSRTGPDGRFSFTALPAVPIELFAESEGHLPWLQRMAPSTEAFDLGNLRLDPAAELVVVVRDDLGVPLMGATLRIEGRPADVTTREGGRAWLDVSGFQPLDLRVSATGHVPKELHLSSPFESAVTVTLERGLIARGVYVDADGIPVSDGRIKIIRGETFVHQPVESDGSFELTLPAGEQLRIEAMSPRTSVVHREVAPGAPGEVRDLGELAAPPGLTVTGQLLDHATALPVAGAKIWVPRPSTKGPLVSWMLDDLLSAVTDSEGHFRLAGAPEMPLSLRVEASGYARRRLSVVPPEAGSRRVDLGEIYLSPGAPLRVLLTEDESPDSSLPATARIDLGGHRLPADTLAAEVVDGVARLAGVPAGEVTVEVTRGDTLLCATEVEIPADEGVVDARCRSQLMPVHGKVQVGGHRAGSGILRWTTPGTSEAPEAVYTYGTGGLKRSKIFSANRAGVTVRVDDEGEFTSRDLRPGRWEVLWMPLSGPSIGPRIVDLPAVDSVEALLINLPGQGVAGTVVDSAGRPVEGARVQTGDGLGFAISKAGGGFVLGGLAPGRYRVRARIGQASSDWVEATVEEGRDSPPVELELRDQEAAVILTVTRRGALVPGGMVFVESEGRPLRILTLDGQGRVKIPLEVAIGQWRIAMHADGGWSLGAWRQVPGGEDAIEVEMDSERGMLSVAPDELPGPLGIEGPRGWRVDHLLQWLGTPVTTSALDPTLLTGLPEGRYRLQRGDRERVVEVESGELTEVEFTP